ncbi:MAG: hypothetical protein JWR44_1343 [Hymenobacter sp.]|jgi:hypothetical protein|nr:hypothetical protein [Hymenobacter sp.]
MKKLLILAALATSIATASAQTPRSRGGSPAAAERAATTTRDSPSNSAINTPPTASPGNGQRTGRKINTAPATGPTRASRSSSTMKSARQGGATGSGNIESISKSANGAPKPRK